MKRYTTIIGVEELQHNLLDPSWRIIDCRFGLGDLEKGRRDHQEAHIPGSVYAHLDDDLSGDIIPGTTGRHPLPSIEKCVDLFSNWGIDQDAQVVVFDYSHGGIAARLWWMLNWLGHENVAVLNGGWQAWQSAEAPVTNFSTPPPNTQFIARVNEEKKVNVEWVEKISQQSNSCLIDSRAAKRYQGIEEPIDPIAGHIPGAANFPFTENVNPDGTWKTKEAIRSRFEALFAEQKVEDYVFYCGSGVTACHNLLALKYAGFGEAKLYPGSWSHWITGTHRVIVQES